MDFPLLKHQIDEHLENHNSPVWNNIPTLIQERKNSSEMNVSDLTINLCESQLTTLKNKKVVAFQKYTADRKKEANLEQIYT